MPSRYSDNDPISEKNYIWLSWFFFSHHPAQRATFFSFSFKMKSTLPLWLVEIITITHWRKLERLISKCSCTCVPFIIWFVQRVLGHALQEQLKDGGCILFPIMPQDVHWWLAPEETIRSENKHIVTIWNQSLSELLTSCAIVNVPEIEGLGVDVGLCEKGSDIVKATKHHSQVQSWRDYMEKKKK